MSNTLEDMTDAVEENNASWVDAIAKENESNPKRRDVFTKQLDGKLAGIKDAFQTPQPMNVSDRETVLALLEGGASIAHHDGQTQDFVKRLQNAATRFTIAR